MKKTKRIIFTMLTVMCLTAMSITASAASTKSSSSASKTEESTDKSSTDKNSSSDKSSSSNEADTAYQEALDAYREAKRAKQNTELEDELDQMVKDGQLTKEQAEILKKQAKEEESLANGVCPSCGYKFSTGGFRGGRGGHGRGGFGGRRGTDGGVSENSMPDTSAGSDALNSMNFMNNSI